MANLKDLSILKQGVKAWNTWREENSTIKPDLSCTDLGLAPLKEVNFEGVNLISTVLYRANLSYANLSHAHLADTNLLKADLSWADLSFSNLVDANLDRANLNNTRLYHTNLSRANLNGANLQRAKFMGANLIGVNLTKANVNETYLHQSQVGLTTFGDIDLTKLIGLETLEHRGPSTLGIDTIYRVNGDIPELFLRGCGIPEIFIAYVHSLTSEAIQFYSCFVSYSSSNQDFANRIYADLQNKGVRCWFAPEDLKIGDKIRDSIDESIRLRDKLLLILSEHSIESTWVEHEVESALEEERQRNRPILFPIRIDDAVMDSNKAWATLIRRTRHIGDFRRWKEHDKYQVGFERLLRDLKTESNTIT